MTVKITIEYENVEQAIIALGKMSGLSKARRAASAPLPVIPAAGAAVSAPGGAAEAPQGSVTAAPAAPRGRKPRSDAGKTRGPYKDNAGSPATEAQASAPQGAASTGSGPDNPAADAQATGSATTGDSTATAPAPVDGAPIPTQEQAQAALEKLFNAFQPASVGIDKAKNVLSLFGVLRVRDLPAEKRAEFIEQVNAAMPKAAA